MRNENCHGFCSCHKCDQVPSKHKKLNCFVFFQICIAITEAFALLTSHMQKFIENLLSFIEKILISIQSGIICVDIAKAGMELKL